MSLLQRATRTVAVCAVVAGVVFSASCDTTQPASLGIRSFELEVEFLPSGLDFDNYAIFEMFRDNDDDNVPDDVNNDGMEDTWLWCVTTGIGEQQLPTSIPWGYDVEVFLIRAGETASTLLTDSSSSNGLDNLSNYDEAEPIQAAVTQLPITVDVMGVQTTYKFRNGFVGSPFRREVMEAISNPLSDLDPTTFGLGAGLCSNFNPGPPTLGDTVITDDAANLVFGQEINTGDTIIVQVRGADTTMIDPAVLVTSPRLPRPRAQARLDGVDVTGTATGDTDGADPTVGFRFVVTAL